MRSKSEKLAITGIKPTGEPHLGNYVGAIKPGIDLARQMKAIYFIADYHALNSVHDPNLIRHYSRSVAASWVACGLDVSTGALYKQSDVPEVFELTTVIANVTPKGLMNRAHAYKSSVDNNRERGADLDAGINMGLFVYPILMAADILAVNADIVPVGADQRQHVEIAVDIAERFNGIYGSHFSFSIPTAYGLGRGPAEIPGIDGRKMSKSYNNTIPIFADSDEIARRCKRIITNSLGVDQPKVGEGTPVYEIYAALASIDDARSLSERLRAGGVGWGSVKNDLTSLLVDSFGPMRERYMALMKPASELDDILRAGAEVARERSRDVLARVRKAIGVD